MDFHIDSLYICVKDMDRAISFYEGFFECPVSERGEVYSVFVINGFRFGLFAFERVNEPHTYGTNCLPSVCVEGLDALKSKTQNYNVVFPITQIGQNWVCELEDSEGNRIEMTAPCESLLVLVRYSVLAGKRAEFLEKLSSAGIAEASSSEEGNIRYEVFLPADSENDVCLTEVWADEAAQKLHGKTPHYEKLTALKKEYVNNVVIEKHLLRDFK